MSDRGAKQPLRILIADDHPMIRDGIESVLERQADLQVVGVAGSYRELPEAVMRHRPDLVLLDLDMPGDPRDMKERFARANGLPVLVYTGNVDPLVEAGALVAGAVGYLDKGRPIDELLRTIRSLRSARGNT